MHLPHIETVSAQVHAFWMAAKLAAGVTSRKLDTTGEELMVPYDQLSEQAKELDRGTVRAVYDAINASREFPVDGPTAMGLLLHSYAMTRDGWNGKGMFVYFVPANAYPAQTDVAKAHFGEDAMVPYNGYFAIKGVDGRVSVWVPSTADLQATDWRPYSDSLPLTE